MGILFEGWLRKTRDLQKNVYFIDLNDLFFSLSNLMDFYTAENDYSYKADN